MNKKLIILVLAAVLVLSQVGAGWAGPPTGFRAESGQPQAGTSQSACPVLGGKINPGIHVDYQGQRVYFCCADCIDRFNKEPEKYLKKKKGV